jgi:hypothetical protein
MARERHRCDKKTDFDEFVKWREAMKIRSAILNAGFALLCALPLPAQQKSQSPLGEPGSVETLLRLGVPV